MSLRLRLLLGYGYLVALILLMAGSSVLGFLDLSAGIDRVLDENFRSIAASMRMLEALERQDSATLAVLIDPDADEGQGMHTFEESFAQAMAEAEANITEDAERNVLTELRQHYDRYRQARDDLIQRQPQRPLRAYNDTVAPAFFAAKRAALSLLDINHAAMVNADREARQTAIRSGAWLGFLVLVALFSLLLLSRAMQRHVLERLSILNEVTEVIAEGDEHRRLPDDGRDELSIVAWHFNTALDRHAELAATMEGRLCQQRQLTLALAQQQKPPLAILGLDGSVVVDLLDQGSASPVPAEALTPVRDWVCAEGPPLLRRLTVESRPRATKLETPAGTASVTPLLAARQRPVGWLVQFGAGTTRKPRTRKRAAAKPAVATAAEA